MATSQTAAFRRIVADHMAPPPIMAAPDEPSAAVVRRMAEACASAATVVDVQGRPLGIVTEQDVVRRLAGPRSDRRARS